MTEIRKPDLNAPRFRKTTHVTLNNSFIETLQEKIPECASLSSQEIKDVIYTFNENVWNTVIDVRDGVELPSQLGHIFIGTCPPSKKRSNVDYNASIEYMQKIKHRNFESDQHIAKIFYTTFGNKYRFKNNELWAFDATRDFKRAVGKTYPENWKRYIQVDPKIKISNVYKSNSYKMDKQEEDVDLLKNYNEFDL